MTIAPTPPPTFPQRIAHRAHSLLHPSAGPVPRAARTVAFLFGAALALGIPAYVLVLQSIFGPSAIVGSMVIGVFLVCGAAGPWSARRAAMSLVRLWAEAVQGAFPGAQKIKQMRVGAESQTPDGLAWLLQSVLGLLAGALMLAGLLSAAVVRHVWSILSTQFFWTPVTETVCLCVMMIAMVGLTGMTAGLQLAALYSAASSTRTTHANGPVTRLTASLLLGVAVGLLIHALTGTPGLSAEQWVLLSAVPFFAIALLSVFIARWAEYGHRPHRPRSRRPSEVEPEWTVGGEPRRLILASAAAWGVAAALWACALVSTADAAAGRAFEIGGSMFAALAIGAWFASWPQAQRRWLMGGCGMALWTAGVAIMATAALSSAVGNGRGSSLAGLLSAAIASGCLGHALSYGRRAYVARCDSERQALAQWCAATLLALTVGLVGFRWLRTGPASGAMAVAAACLILLILGGLLVIHERSGTRRVRKQRVVAVFASLGLAVVTLPAAAKRVPADAHGGRHAGPIAAHSQWTVLPDAGFRWTEPGARIASLGDIAVTTAPAVWRIDHVLWNADAVVAERSDALNVAASLNGPPRVYGDADAWWRRSRSRYDFIVQTADGLSPADMASRLSWEWFEGLRRRLLPKGALLVELPVAYLDAPGAASVARTFAAAFESYDRWFLVADSDAASRVYLLAMPESRGQTAAPRTPPRQVSSAAAAPWRRRPMNDADFSDAPLNTLRRPAFRASPEPRTSGTDAMERL